MRRRATKRGFRVLSTFDAAPLSYLGGVVHLPMRALYVDAPDLVDATAKAWQTAYGQRPHFNWPAVHAFNPGAATIALSTNAGATIEGLMLIRNRHKVRCPNKVRGPLTYVAYLEIAPWNRPGHANRHFRGLGSLLLQIASAWSTDTNSGGVIGLHSLPDAEAFYRGLGFQQQDCCNEHHELYFELPAEAATEFQNRGRLIQ